MLTAFLSGPTEARETLRAAAEDLRTVGWGVQARWLDADAPTDAPGQGLSDKYAAYLAAACLEDIDAADVVLAFTAAASLPRAVLAATMAATVHAHLDGTHPGQTPGGAGGRHIEVGYALATGRDVVLIGQPENLYHRTLISQVHPDWHTALIALAGRLVSHERYSSAELSAQLVGVRRDLRHLAGVKAL